MLESTQAKIVGVLSVLGLILSGIALVMKSSIVAAAIGLVFSALFALFIVFDTNCTIIGGCNIWGWIKTVLISITLIAIIIADIQSFVKKEEAKTTEEAPTKAQ